MRFFRRAFFSRLGWLVAGGVPAARAATSEAVSLPADQAATGPADEAAASAKATAVQSEDAEVIRADYDLIVVGGGVRRLLALQAGVSPRHRRLRPDAGARARPDPVGRYGCVWVLGDRHPHAGWDTDTQRRAVSAASHGRELGDLGNGGVWHSTARALLTEDPEFDDGRTSNQLLVRGICLVARAIHGMLVERRLETLVEAHDNYVRRRVQRFETVQSQRVRLTVLATNGAPSARVYEMRVYLV
jgi:hypothetical protein